MSNLTRYVPFDPVLDPFDDLFRGFFRPVRSLDQEAARFKMDVKEDDKAYTVHADLPGVEKDDIHVSIEGSAVAISAEVRSESEQKEDEKVLMRERSHGRIYRSFTLASDVDEAAATAKYRDGVLELVLPKKAPATGKRLVVQ